MNGHRERVSLSVCSMHEGQFYSAKFYTVTDSIHHSMIIQRNGSSSSSSAAQGYTSSKFFSTTGCTIPKTPICGTHTKVMNRRCGSNYEPFARRGRCRLFVRGRRRGHQTVRCGRRACSSWHPPSPPPPRRSQPSATGRRGVTD